MSRRVYVILSGLLWLGCEAKAPTPPPPASGEVTQESGVIEAAKEATPTTPKQRRPRVARGALTPERYEAQLLALAECEVGLFGVERDCAAWREFEAERKGRRLLMKTATEALAALGRKHIKHASPAVRLQAASLINGLFKVKNEEVRDLITAAAKVEENPMVLKRFVRILSSAIAKSDEVRLLIISLADHPHDKVRVEVAKALTDSWASGTEGTLERAIKMVNEDPDEGVRVYTCKYLGARADDRALPTFERYLKTPVAPEQHKLYAACLRGLIKMWSRPVPHTTPSKKAYQLTLKLLAERPQPNDIWTVLSALEWVVKPKFKAAAKAWYEEAKLIAILEAFVLDKEFYWLGRSQAADVLAKITKDKARMEALKAKLEGSGVEGDDTQVLRKLSGVIAKMK